MRALLAFLRDRRGSSAVEFAFLGPGLIFLIFGVTEFARIEWTREVLKQVAVAGARCMGVVQPQCGNGAALDTGKAQAFVVAEASRRTLTLTTSNVAVSSTATCATVSGFSQVTITYPMTLIVPLPNVGRTVNLSSSACFPNQS